MRISIVARLAALVGVIIVASTLVLATIVHRATSTEFVTVLEEELGADPAAQEPVAIHLEEAFATAGMQGIIDAAALATNDRGATVAPFLVVDDNLHVLATTEPALEEAAVTRREDGNLQVLLERRTGDDAFDVDLIVQTPRRLAAASGEVIGELIVLPEPIDAREGQDFAGRMWRTAGPWLILVLVVAVVSTVWVLRRFLRPIDTLTTAAGALGDGEFPGELDPNAGSAEFDKLIGTFNAATRALQETDGIRRRFISDIAHELRTPITNIKGQLEALQEGLIEPDGAFRTTMTRETRLLERLVEDFQEIAITDAGQLRLTLQPLPLHETVESFLAPMVQRSGATLRNEIPVLYTVVADEERLGQVLSNLFENARREMPAGLEIRTRARPAGQRIELRFEDNGPGIDEGDRRHIFDRLYRGEKSRNRATGGAGLGLTIVKGLVEAMGGEIWYEPVDSGGSAFVVSLPVRNLDT